MNHIDREAFKSFISYDDLIKNIDIYIALIRGVENSFLELNMPKISLQIFGSGFLEIDWNRRRELINSGFVSELIKTENFMVSVRFKYKCKCTQGLLLKEFYINGSVISFFEELKEQATR